MSPYYAKLEVLKTDFKDLYELLRSSVGNVYYSVIDGEPVKIGLIIGTKWFFKTNSDVSVSIIIKQFKEKLLVDIIGYGGREGVFKLGLGVNEDFVNNVLKILKKNKVKYKVLAKMHYSNPSRIESI